MKKLLFIFSLFLILPFFNTPTAQAATFANGSAQGGNTTITEPITSDAFVAGNTIKLNAPIEGDTFAAGTVVTIKKLVGRSIYAAGSVVTIEEGSKYNTFAAGSTVTLSGTYGHDVYVAGTTVIISDGTVINGDLHVGGSAVTLSGTIKGNVFSASEQLTSSSIVGGSFNQKGARLAFTGGSIGGNLEYQSTDIATDLTKVAVTGKTTRTDLPKPADNSASRLFFGWLLSLVSTFALGAFLIFLSPKRIDSQSMQLKNDWTKMAAIGIVSLILMPILIIATFVTVVGWKIGLVLLALYCIALLVSHVVAVITLGHLILDRLNQKNSLWISLLIGLVCLSLLSVIPLIGGLFSLMFFIGLVVPSFGLVISGMRQQAKS